MEIVNLKDCVDLFWTRSRIDMPFYRKKLFFTLLIALLTGIFFIAATKAASACDDCDEPGTVDADDAYSRSLRAGRDPVEGFWGIYMDWNPDPESARSFRMAIVTNTYDIYPEADYVGVATCSLPGCDRGEIKLLLKKTGRKNEFEGTLLTQKGGAKGQGKALLVDADDGRPLSALDLRDLKYEDRVMAKWMLRIIGG
ncbi:MAG: hypothetical protein LBS45_10915 [Synergistaceae bacterium]|jgi:hypothetical protein|nr:hypothetical protein [Synergistaceae bacterium]